VKPNIKYISSPACFLLLAGLILHPAWGQPVALQYSSGGTNQPGNPAIHADSSIITAWAVSCDLERGPGLITYPDSIEVTNGEAASATGKAGDGVVSLGDGGRATLRFDRPIANGPGPDFAVFENSFDGTFLELGFVEVSSDGQNFTRFPAESRTQTDSQVWTFGTLDPLDIYNLAGKYKAGWGTSFDLAELEDIPGLDIQTVVAVRIIDVIGILDDSIGSKDASGDLVNDPFPTPFESCGFDLDGVGVLHQVPLAAEASNMEASLRIYPVPCTSELYVENPDEGFQNWALLDLNGRTIRQGKFRGQRQEIDLEGIPQGSYFLRCSSGKTIAVRRILKTTR